jgi:hypothetical protein
MKYTTAKTVIPAFWAAVEAATTSASVLDHPFVTTTMTGVATEARVDFFNSVTAAFIAFATFPVPVAQSLEPEPPLHERDEMADWTFVADTPELIPKFTVVVSPNVKTAN